jgi:ABC-type uncharacterized transport system permease subunit
MDIVLYAFTALLYAALALLAWRTHLESPLTLSAGGAAAHDAAPHRAVRPRAAPLRSILLLIALVAHGTLLHLTIFPPQQMLFGFAFALSAMLWLGVGIYWIESFFFPLDGLGLLALPLACVASLLPLVFGGVRVLPYAADPLFELHFVIANIAYGLLALAALHAVLMLLVGRRLHGLRGARARAAADNGLLGNWLDTLPPLLTLEKLLFRLINAGFVLLTLTLISGMLFTEQLLHRALQFDHKTVFAILSWLMFGGLLVGRRLYGWRGRAALRWVLASFGALFLAYVGSRFVLEVLLHRAVA